VNLVQERGQTLHFVHHHPTSILMSLNLLPKRLGLATQRQPGLGAQEIKPKGTGKCLPEPGCFPGPTGSEQEERVVGHPKPTCYHRQQFDRQNAGEQCKNAKGNEAQKAIGSNQNLLLSALCILESHSRVTGVSPAK
jgi:hypothetical protein